MKIRIWYNGGTQHHYVQSKKGFFSRWQTMRTFDRRWRGRDRHGPAIFAQLMYATDFVKQLQEQAAGTAYREKRYKEESKVIMETEI